MKVIIDGVEYIPAKNVVANELDIKKALLLQFWGVLKDSQVDEHCSDLRVVVSDYFETDQGQTIQELINEIAKISKNEPQAQKT